MAPSFHDIYVDDVIYLVESFYSQTLVSHCSYMEWNGILI